MRIARARRLSPSARRNLVVGGLALLGALLILALIWALMGGLPSLFISSHTSPSPNQGKSVLVLSKPATDRYATVTLLTMTRTSDGKTLWQYHLPGDLANGFSSTAEEQVRAGTAIRIVNGVVYFAEVLDTRPDRPALTAFRLTALRADTGARLWQRQTQATTLEVLGVSDGVLVAQATTGSNYTIEALTAYGYRADTGAPVWERQLATHIGYSGLPARILDGSLYLYVKRQEGAPWVLTALDARTGKPHWQFTRQDMALLSAAPVAAADGVIVQEGFVFGGSGRQQFTTLSLIGLRERDGALLWSRELAPQGNSSGSLALPTFQASGGFLYFATNSPDQANLALNALRIASGTLLWRQRIMTQRVITNQQSSGGRGLAFANGTLYLVYALPAPAASPAAYGLAVQAVRARDGAPGWGQVVHPGQGEDPGLTIVEGATASAVVMWSSDSEHTPLMALDAGDGATLWRDQRITYGELVADGTLLAFSVPAPPDLQLRPRLCALRPATGAPLWCDQFDGVGGWVIVGP